MCPGDAMYPSTIIVGVRTLFRGLLFELVPRIATNADFTPWPQRRRQVLPVRVAHFQQLVDQRVQRRPV